VEVHGDELMSWADGEARGLATRIETSGDTAFCYAADPAQLLASLSGRALRYLHRPADLEDVFLKLTGRELRD
jgi:lipooligosaccharide transport system ATP-binding protein